MECKFIRKELIEMSLKEPHIKFKITVKSLRRYPIEHKFKDNKSLNRNQLKESPIKLILEMTNSRVLRESPINKTKENKGM